jgi:hypothetical protein
MMNKQTETSLRHPSNHEHDIAVAVVLWVILAGFCVVAANAWAASTI